MVIISAEAAISLPVRGVLNVGRIMVFSSSGMIFKGVVRYESRIVGGSFLPALAAVNRHEVIFMVLL